jgi:hypothetical protein
MKFGVAARNSIRFNSHGVGTIRCSQATLSGRKHNFVLPLLCDLSEIWYKGRARYAVQHSCNYFDEIDGGEKNQTFPYLLE